MNIHLTVAHSEASVREFIRFGNRLLFRTRLLPAFRELAILRIARHYGAHYEWTHHIPLAKQAGLTEQHINALECGKEDVFEHRQRLIIQWVDETIRSGSPGDETFEEVRRFLDIPSIVELVLTIGYWSMVAMVLRTFQVELEDHQ